MGSKGRVVCSVGTSLVVAESLLPGLRFHQRHRLVQRRINVEARLKRRSKRLRRPLRMLQEVRARSEPLTRMARVVQGSVLVHALAPAVSS